MKNLLTPLKSIEEEAADCRAAFVKALANWSEVWADCEKSKADCEKSKADCREAGADYDKVLAASQEELIRLHDLDWPDNSWNGRSIL